MGDVWLALRERLPAHLVESEWLEAVVAFYVENRTRLSRLPGALETIEMLAERGIPQVCVSNSARSIVEANLDVLGVADFIRFTISVNDISAGKPDPEPYRTACERLGSLPSEVLAVEDSLTEGLKEIMAPGALDPPTKELIYLAVSITNGCEYCTVSHTAAAKKAGMTKDMRQELIAVIGMANNTNRIVNAYHVDNDPKFVEAASSL